MANGDFKLLQELFSEVVELPATQWQQWIEQHAPAELRARLEKLVRRQSASRLIDEDAAATSLAATMRKALPAAFVEGQKIDDYTVEKLIGRGGMGSVYLATRHADGIKREVALKLIRAQDMNPELLRRFSNERRVLAALDHPGICKFLDAGALPDGTPYVVMERVRGEPLVEFCNGKQLSIRQRVALLRRIAAAVEYAHTQLIVHRDIKPSNVLVDEHGEPKLLDFGIAKSISDEVETEQTATAQRFLTPGSAAPEQLLGEPVGVGCDVYMLGNLAYQLLADVPPFVIEGLRAAEIERLTLKVPPELMSRRVQALSAAASSVAQRVSLSASKARELRGDLDSIVARCLRKAPFERYPNVAELIADLSRYLEGHPVQARGGERSYRLRKFVGRHRLAVALSTMLISVLLLGAGMLAVQAYRLAEQRNAAVLERDRANQVVEILREAFLASDPARFTEGAVSVTQVLRDAQARISSLAVTQPSLFVSLADTIVDVRLGLGMDADAIPLALEALDVLKKEHDAGAMRARIELKLATALTHSGRRQEAASLLDAWPEDARTRAPEWQLARAQLDRSAGEYRAAAEVSSAALALVSERGPRDMLATQIRWLRIEIARDRARYAEAVELIDQTLDWQLQDLPGDHPWLTLTEMRRISVLRRQGDPEAAISVAERVRDQLETLYGTESPMAGRGAFELGLVLASAGRGAHAKSAILHSLDIWTRSLGETHGHTIKAAYNLATVLEETHDPSGEVSAAYLRALGLAERRFGKASDTTQFMRNTTVRFLLDSARPGEALRVAVDREANAGLPRLLPTNLSRHLELLARARAAACDGPRSKLAVEAEAECNFAAEVLSHPWTSTKLPPNS